MTASGESNGARALRCMHFLATVQLEHGGVERAMLDWCRIIADRGHQVTLVTFDPKDVPPAWRSGGQGLPRTVVIDRPRLRTGGLSRAAMRQLHDILREIDIVHLHTLWDPTTTKIGKLTRQHGVPYIITVHGMLDDYCVAAKPLKKRIYLAVGGRRFLEQAARIHCTAQGELAQASKWFPNGRPVVQPLIFDLAPFIELPGVEPARKAFPALAGDEPKILFLSRVDPKKWIELLIRAAVLLRDQGLKLTVLIAGPAVPAYLEQLTDLINENQLQDSVHYLGMVRGIEKISLYQACDLFVLPTHQENFGLVLPEAMACGTPVITTRGVDIWPELESGGATIVDSTPEAIAKAIRDLLSDPEALAARGERARRFVCDWLNPTELAARYEALYRDAIADPTGSAAQTAAALNPSR